MASHFELKPPGDEGRWTLLQQRVDRALWQWDRRAADGHTGVTRYVIINAPSRLDFDDFDEAEAMFETMGD